MPDARPSSAATSRRPDTSFALIASSLPYPGGSWVSTIARPLSILTNRFPSMVISCMIVSSDLGRCQSIVISGPGHDSEWSACWHISQFRFPRSGLAAVSSSTPGAPANIIATRDHGGRDSST